MDGATTFDLSNIILDGYARIKAKIDLNNAASQVDTQQFSAVVETSTTALFPALTQEDINNTGRIYEQELAVVKIEAGNVTSVTRQMGSARMVDADKLGVDTSQAEFYTVEKMGGNKAVTLASENIPAGVGFVLNSGIQSNMASFTYTTGWGVKSNSIFGVAHDNLQPYITCYMWKRMS